MANLISSIIRFITVNAVVTIQTDSIPDLNCTEVNCTTKIEEYFTVSIFYNSPSVNKQDFLDQIELLLTSLSKNKKNHLLGDIDIDLLENSPVANWCLNLLEIHGCSQGMRELTRATQELESSINHIIHNNYQRPLEIGDIKTLITDNFATYVGMNVYGSQSIPFQHFFTDRPFFRDGNVKNLYLIYLNHCLNL